MLEWIEQSPEHETMLMTIAEQLEQKGREQGRTEGKVEGKLETASALLRYGVSLDIIVTSTGLSRDKIEATYSQSWIIYLIR